MKKTPCRVKGWFDTSFGEKPKMELDPPMSDMDMLFEVGKWFEVEIADEPWEDCLEIVCLTIETVDGVIRNLPDGKFYRISRIEVCPLCDSLSCAHAEEANFRNWERKQGLFGKWFQK